MRYERLFSPRFFRFAYLIGFYSHVRVILCILATTYTVNTVNTRTQVLEITLCPRKSHHV